MRQRLSDALVGLYERAVRAGALDRPRPRRAFEWVYLGYKRLIEAGPIDGLRGLVAHGSTVIDVGANIGFFSVRFARWVGPAGRVIAIEPEARNIDSLRHRVARAGLSSIVDCVQAAAADRPGQLRLALTPGHPGDHHLADAGEPVEAVTLDELVAQDFRPVTLIKIDVQGAETMVLAGARSVIEAHHPAIYVEVDGTALARLGSSPRGLIETAMGLGYRPHRLTRRGVRGREQLDGLLARSSAGYIDVLLLPG
jgi:FkbM family methyltransferase